MIELAIRDLREGAGLEHIPSGHLHANAAWLGCSVLAHNIGIWTSSLADQQTVTNRTRRTQLIALAAVIVNRSAGICSGSRPHGPGPASSSRCSDRSGRSPHPLLAETDTRGLTHPRQAERRQTARYVNARFDASRPPTQPVRPPPNHPRPPQARPSEANRWIEAKGCDRTSPTSTDPPGRLRSPRAVRTLNDRGLRS